MYGLPRTLSVFDADMSELTYRDALASEAAAFTIDELSRELTTAGLDDLRLAHSTPLPVWQMRWAPQPGATAAASPRWVEKPLPRDAARAARMQRYKGLPPR